MMELFLEPAREIEIRWIQKQRQSESKRARVEVARKVRGV